MTEDMSNIERFMRYAQERQMILKLRRAGAPRPWTQDPILQEYRFCCVYREDDATTQWFREWVREPLRSRPEVLMATVLFRWFNRMLTGDAIFRQIGDYGDIPGRATTAWGLFLETGDTAPIRQAVKMHCGSGPYTTGSYIIKSPQGYDKLDGVLRCVGKFYHGAPGVVGWQAMAETCLRDESTTLEQVWGWLRKADHLGDFMAYEIVTDLRHTDLLRRAPDIYTWANPGPGAMRGLNRIHGRDLEHRQPKHAFICEMRTLLWAANNEWQHVWPHRFSSLHGELAVEMRDIEHTLCEFDKYERARLGQGRPRGVFR